MENNETSVFDNFDSGLSETSKTYLKEAGKWAYFISIIGFIGIGFMVIIAFFAGAISSFIPQSSGVGAFPSVFITVIYLIIAALYFLPVYYLFSFGKNIKKGFAENDNEALENGFKFLKSHYKFIGFITLIILGIYALVFIVAIFGALLQ